MGLDGGQEKRRKIESVESLSQIGEEAGTSGAEFRPKSPFDSMAQDCIKFQLVHSQGDTASTPTPVFDAFYPDYTHHLFGEHEVIYGYRDLQIKVSVHAASLRAQMECSYSIKTAGRKRKPDDFKHILEDALGPTLSDPMHHFDASASSGHQEFSQLVQKYGQVVDTWQKPARAQQSADASGMLPFVGPASCQIIKMDLSKEDVRQWHSRMQGLVTFFIDNGKPIDNRDPLWDLYVAVERHTLAQGEQVYVAGYCTAYRFYHHPDSTRMRISQVLVLPPYQGKGHGRRLIQAVNAAAVKSGVYDVAVEDPSDELQCLRETMDVMRLLSFPPAVAAVSAALQGPQKKLAHADAAGEDGSAGPVRIVRMPSELVEAARAELKLSKRQLHRCWEVLLHLRVLDEEGRKAWKKLVRDRLYLEEFGGKKDTGTHAAKSKRVLDTGFLQFDHMMFVMMTKARWCHLLVASGGTGASKEVEERKEHENEREPVQDEEEGEGAARQALTPQETAKAVQEHLEAFYKEREAEVFAVAEKVRRLQSLRL
eukprot:jgi/Mesen1/6325/ME000326S05462